MTDSAKDRLLQAALKIFATHGFEGASTRLLAKEAGVNISAIPYYFSGKEGLYKAALEHIAKTVQSNIAPQVAEIQKANQNADLTPEQCRKMLYGAMRGMGEFLLGETLSPHIVRIFIREQVDPTLNFGSIYENTMRPVHEMLTSVVARLTGLPFPSEQATLCAHTLIGQIIVFKTHKEAALRRLGWKHYGPKEIEKIMQTVLRNSDAIIESYRRGQS